ncbi:MAG TPA: hypothetical protein VEP90_24075 [Methylomirabilota bacterium]|nr:hypothetical protein [Methylomirabilota bacterium]
MKRGSVYKRRELEWKVDTFGEIVKSFTTSDAAFEAFKNLSAKDKKATTVYKKFPNGKRVFLVKNGRRVMSFAGARLI